MSSSSESNSGRSRIVDTYLATGRPAVLLDSVGNIIAANDETFEMTGYSRSDLEEIPDPSAWIEVLIPDRNEAARTRQFLLSLFEKGVPLASHMTHATSKNGSALSISATAFRFDAPPPDSAYYIIHLNDITRYAQSREELLRSEANLSFITAHLTDVVWAVDADGVFTFVTPSVERCIGYSAEDVIGTSLISYLTPESIERFQEEMRHREEHSYYEPIVMDVEHITREGTTKWCEISADYTFDNTMNFTGLAGVSRDVTERKVAEERMRENEIRYRGLFDRSLDCVYIHDFEGDFIDANPSALNLLGYSRREIKGLNFSDLIDESQMEQALRTNQEILASGHQRQTTEYSLKKKSGALVQVETNASLIYRSGKPYAIQGIARDITERNRAQTTMREMLAKVRDYESIINRSPVVVFLWRVAKGWPVDFVSDNVSHYGYTPDDFTSGRVSWPGITHPDDVPRLERELRINAECGLDEFRQEYRLITSDGDIRWVDDMTKAIHDENGVISHYQGIILDVTERKRAMEKEQRYFNHLRFLTDSAFEFVKLSPDDDMYRHICEKLHEITGGAAVAISSFDDTTNQLVTREFIGLSGRMKTLVKHLGRHPVGMRFTLTEKQKKSIGTGGLNRVDGIRELTFEQLPRILCSTIERIFNIGAIYGIGFVTQGRIYGVTTIIMFQDSPPLHTDLVESFCNQAAIALQRWLAERALRENEHKYHSLAESIRDIMYSTDMESRIQYIGPQIRRYGYTSEEVTGRSFFEFVHPDDLETVRKEFELSILRGEEFPSQFRMMAKGGEVIWVEDNGMIQYDNSGEVTGLTGILRDITLRKEAEEALKRSESMLREQTEKLEQKNIALREVVGQIEIEKNTLKDEIITNVRKLVYPILDQISHGGPSEEYIDLLRHVLDNLTSSFGRAITELNLRLTPREVEICTMIKTGLTNKEIARLMNISTQTVENHRKHIRQKLNLTNQSINLATYLRRMS